MNSDIKRRVNYYVTRCGTRNPFEIAKQLNIEVQLGNPGCDGCYMFLKNHRYIFLNQDLTETELRVIMAHELGHAILHRKQNCYFIRNKTFFLNSKYEIEANKFAAELLLPDELLNEYEGFTMEQISKSLGYHECLFELKFR